MVFQCSVLTGIHIYHPVLDVIARGARTWLSFRSCMIAFTGRYTRPRICAIEWFLEYLGTGDATLDVCLTRVRQMEVSL